jgi:hypothetical protein
VDRTRRRVVVIASSAAVAVAGGVGLVFSVVQPSADATTRTRLVASATAAAVFSTSADAVRWERAYLDDLYGKRVAREQEARAMVADRAAWARAKAARVKTARLVAARAKTARRVTAAAADSGGSPRTFARRLLAARGMGSAQFSCLDQLWTRESGWRVTAENPVSHAYGIPQALPGEKMASEGADWRTNATTQIRWGIRYIASRYGTPCGAWQQAQSFGWY